MDRLARLFDGLDRVLGRLVFRALGACLFLLCLLLLTSTYAALERGTLWQGAGIIEGVGALVFGSLGVYCFRRNRRLSDIDS